MLHLFLQVGPPPSVVVDQADLFTHIFSPAASREVPLDRLQVQMCSIIQYRLVLYYYLTLISRCPRKLAET